MIYTNINTYTISIPTIQTNTEVKWFSREDIKSYLKNLNNDRNRRYYKKVYRQLSLMHNDPKEKKYWFRRWQKG